MNSQDLIVKDNRLITSKYHLSSIQVKFLSYLSTLINKNDNDFTTYTLRVQDLLTILNIKRSNYRQLRGTLRKLSSKYVVLQDTKEVIEETTFISYFKIDKTNDLILVRFDKSLKPFLLQLKTNFTKLSFSKILCFDSQYTIRFYELIELKANLYEKYKNKHLLYFQYGLEELQEMLLGNFNPYTEKLEIPKSYQVFSNFKKRVLNPAYKELKEKGDYYFEYELIKTGKKVISLNFQIFKNGEKIRKDFHKKKKLFIQNSTTRELAKEQIRRIMERNKNTIKDPLKYEQKLFQLYLQGALTFDTDIQKINNLLV